MVMILCTSRRFTRYILFGPIKRCVPNSPCTAVVRFTEQADLVLCTDGERDDLAKLTLSTGRLYAAFVADEAKVEGVTEKIKHERNRAIEEGRFKLYNGVPPVYIGRNQWPTLIPRGNVSKDSQDKLAALVQRKGSGRKCEHERAVAAETAEKFGLEVKVIEGVSSGVAIGPKRLHVCRLHHFRATALFDGRFRCLRSNSFVPFRC